jgi:hypothetical protein
MFFHAAAGFLSAGVFLLLLTSMLLLVFLMLME